PILLWPQNGSHILSTNEIYFDIYGGTHELSYSWDFGGWYMIPEPWTISVPSDGGWHTLQIEAENYFGQITSQEYRFYVEHQLTSFNAYEMSITPEIDGIRQSWEKDDASEFELIFLSEDGTTSHSKMSVGFLNDSLYLGVETSIPDGLYTSIMIYIDADGSHRWGDSSPGVVMDYLVSVNAPSSLIEENIVMFCDGSSITLQDSAIEFAVATQNDLISFEGIFNSETLNPDMSQVQFSVRIQQGGVSDYFPLPYYSLESFQLATIEYLGPKPTHTFLFVGIVVGLGVLMIGVLSLTYRKSKLVSSPFLKPLPEEELERVRTLVISYPRVRLEKLQSMSGLSAVEFESALSRLIQDQIVDVDITPTGEVVRNRDSHRAQISGPKTGK
ncbi:MAG: hypothetical protein ACFFDQ_11815, partial [Candidatus Thorarchaeota archaeon]